MKIKITVSDDTIKNEIISALEGGSNYWYFLSDTSMLPERKKDEAISELIGRAVLDEGISIPVYDYEEPDNILGHLTKKSIKKGVQIMAKDYQDHFSYIVTNNSDGYTADIFFQLAVMGEITFG